NSLEIEKANAFTTTTLALSAHKKGHTVYYLEIGDLTYYPNGQMGSLAYVLHPEEKFKDEEELMAKLKSEEVEKKTIKADYLDVLSLRYNPEDERDERTDRKSTRLNSSHVKISYAVFCLKK